MSGLNLPTEIARSHFSGTTKLLFTRSRWLKYETQIREFRKEAEKVNLLNFM